MNVNRHSFVRRPRFTSVFCRALVVGCMLAGNSLVVGDAIHEAAVNGDVAKVKTLLEANPALANSKDNAGRTPLHHAALLGQKSVVELLLANHAEVNARDNYGRTALDIAAIGGYAEVVGLLRQHGALSGKSIAAAEATKPAPKIVAPTTGSEHSASGNAVTAQPVPKPVPAAGEIPKKSPTEKDKTRFKPKVKMPSLDTGAAENNRGVLPLKSRTYKDETELLRER